MKRTTMGVSWAIVARFALSLAFYPVQPAAAAERLSSEQVVRLFVRSTPPKPQYFGQGRNPPINDALPTIGFPKDEKLPDRFADFER